jgi:uncharacterized Fe-S cluster-containing MiaB family protein
MQMFGRILGHRRRAQMLWGAYEHSTGLQLKMAYAALQCMQCAWQIITACMCCTSSTLQHANSGVCPYVFHHISSIDSTAAATAHLQ